MRGGYASSSPSFSVTSSYAGTAARALGGVSFALAAAGVTAIVGSSGAGKSTLFQLIERFHSPDQGTIRIPGADTARMPLGELRSRIGPSE